VPAGETPVRTWISEPCSTGRELRDDRLLVVRLGSCLVACDMMLLMFEIWSFLLLCSLLGVGVAGMPEVDR
jgi:hypothetical protein